MKKYLLFLFITIQAFAQEVVTSPSASSLMRFEDYPVDLYTGIPSISVPLYQMPTRSKDIKINVSLNYHPSSVSAFDELSGDCGRGWNITKGGSISRSVAFIPDEAKLIQNGPGIPDIYRFNFMGFSGKFKMTLGSASGVPYTGVQVLETDYKNLKIEFDYDPDPTKLTINSFTIYDEQGYKYVFDRKETFKYYGIYKIDPNDPYDWQGNPNYTPDPITCPSTYNLTKIYDVSGNMIAEFTYVNRSYDASNVINVLTGIHAPGVGSIGFSPSTSPVVIAPNKKELFRYNSITLRDESGLIIKNAVLKYNTVATLRRLEEIKLYGKGTVSSGSYKMRYQPMLSSLTEQEGIDRWGYYNLTEAACMTEGSGIGNFPRTAISLAASEYSIKGVLNRLTLPTGGCVDYVYEPNTYSAYRNRPLDYVKVQDSLPYTSANFFTRNNSIFPNWHHISIPGSNFQVNNRHNYNQDSYNTSLSTVNTASSKYTFLYTGPSTNRYFKFYAPQYASQPLTENAPVTYLYPSFKLYKASNDQLLGTFDQFDVNSMNDCKGITLADMIYDGINLVMNQQYYIKLAANNNTATGTINSTTHTLKTDKKKWWVGGGIRIKSMKYYSDAVAAEDPYNYPDTYMPTRTVTYDYNLFGQPDRSSGTLMHTGSYSGNSLAFQNMAPAVKYKNITVYDSSVPGRTEYIFTTGFEDFAPDAVDPNLIYPFTIMSPNSGKLTKQRTYNTANNLVVENTYSYDPVPSNTLTLYDFTKLQLQQQTTREYVTNQNFIERSDIFTYYTLNYKLKDKYSSLGNGDVIHTKYFYDTTQQASKNIIVQSDVETSNNSGLVNISKVIYAVPTGSLAYLPYTTSGGKDSNSLRNMTRYLKYDTYGNVLEIEQDQGKRIAIIYGYNNTLPVARIENISYGAIPPSLITAIQSATFMDQNTVPNESTVLTALQNLRNASALTGAMITTYTHKPLIGITSETDPRGLKINYTYDDDNRLKQVTDQNGNILTENKYHFRP